MKLTLKELNEIYYCLGKVLTLNEVNLANISLVEQIRDKVRDEIDIMEYENESNEDDGPEYDSAGFTEDDRIVNGQYRATLEQDEQRYENQHK
jgi:hypothetical protein